MTQHENQKHETPSLLASNGSQARLIGVRIRHDSSARQYLLNFLKTHTVLAAFWPIATVPVDVRYFHAVMIRICLHNWNYKIWCGTRQWRRCSQRLNEYLDHIIQVIEQVDAKAWPAHQMSTACCSVRWRRVHARAVWPTPPAQRWRPPPGWQKSRTRRTG